MGYLIPLGIVLIMGLWLAHCIGQARLWSRGQDEARRLLELQVRNHRGGLELEQLLALQAELILCREYRAWCEREGLPAMSAHELAHEAITPPQQQWLTAFIARWDAIIGEGK